MVYEKKNIKSTHLAVKKGKKLNIKLNIKKKLLNRFNYKIQKKKMK